MDVSITVHGNHAPNACCSVQFFRGKSLKNGSYAGDRIGSRVQCAEGCGIDFKKFKGFWKRSVAESVSRKGESLDFEDSSHSPSGNGHMSSASSLQSLEETEMNNRLQKLVTKGKLDEGLVYLESVRYRGHIPDITMCTSLIRGFCRRGKTWEANRALDIFIDLGGDPDVITYTYLISSYCKAGEIDKALQVFNRMGVAPTVVTYTILIRAICKERSVEQAIKVFDEMRSSGCKPDVGTYNVLVNGICKEGRLDDAIKFVKDMPTVYGCQPVGGTYATLIRAISKKRGIEQGMKLLDEIRSRGCKLNVYTCSVLVIWMCEEGRLEDAIKLLNDMPTVYGCQPDVILYTDLIKATCKERGVGQAMKLLDEMRSRGCTPDVVTYSAIVNGICKEGRFNDAIKFLNDMPSVYGCQPNLYTYNTILHGLCSACRWKEAERLIADMLRKGCSPNLITYNTVIDGLSKVGKTEEAVKLLDEMRGFVQPNTITFNSIIFALCKAQQTDRAIDLLARMVMEGCTPDEATYRNLIEGIACEGLAKEAMELLYKLRAKGVV